MKKASLFLILLIASSCMSQDDRYKDYYKQDSNYLARRNIETRSFDVQDEEKILTSSAEVLQDLGFILNETDAKIGLITAKKKREAATTATKVTQAVVTGYLTNRVVYDTEQEYYVTIVSTKNRNKGYNVRVTFTKAQWNNEGSRFFYLISDEKQYQMFFDKLSQSIFLTSNNI